MMHSSRTKRWVASLIVLFLFLAIAILAVWLLKLTGGERTAMLIGLALLGAIGAAITWHVLRPSDAVSRAEKDEAILALRQAADRLPRGELLGKSLVLLLGPPTSTKTTVVTRSGLDAQLLAGDARGTGPEEPTKAANIWLGGGGALIEAPGTLTADGPRFMRFVRALRAPGLAAALGRREPAPRAIVLCVPCDYLATSDEQKQLDVLAPVLRARLADAANQLGVRVPVYVLFTRLDRLPYVEAWLAPLTREEIRMPLGAALPFDNGAAGAYAERLIPRLELAFASLVASLGARRSELLSRESVEAQRLGAYEVPRELGKLAPAAIRFLAEVTRPSQMGMTPQLRGFWFVGARPVIVRDAAPVAATAAPVDGATGLFRPGMLTGAAVPAAAPAAARKVPEWVFIDRFFTDVVFGDRSARAAALGGVRVSGMRRILLGTLIAGGLLLGLGVTVSWMKNRALASRTMTAVRGVASLPVVQAAPGTIALPSVEALRQLEQLRALLDTITTIDTTGAPLSMRFGLWNGASLVSAARPAWVAGYRRQLHDDAWRVLLDSLRTIPDVPTPASDYGRSYDMLKTYLVGTTEHARSSRDFVTPVLLSSWQRGLTTDSVVTELARRQFDEYASLQVAAQLWPVAADSRLVTHTRDHLGRFAGIDPIYVSMRSAVQSKAKAIKLAEAVPQAAGVVGTGGAIVAAPFTEAGWTAMQDALRNSDRFFQGETWVVGDRSAVASRNREQDLAEIRKRYLADYQAEWRKALQMVSVPRPGTAAQSAARLGKLGGAQSPLLAILALAARNTTGDSALARAFQPVHSVTPPAIRDKNVSETNQEYANALLALQSGMESIVNLPPAKDSAGVLTLQTTAQGVLNAQAAQAKTVARQLEQKFAVDASASQVGPSVARLLYAPIDGAEAVLKALMLTRMPRGAPVGGGGGGGGGGAPAPIAASPVVAPPAGGGAAPAPVTAPMGPDAIASAGGADLAVLLNGRGRDMCRAMERILRKFPFNPDAGDMAEVRDVNALLAPGTGALWKLYDDRLKPMLPLENGNFIPKPANGVTLSPQFVAFFRRMARASVALYSDLGQTPRMALSVKVIPSPEVSIVSLVNGDRTLRWPGADVQSLGWPSGGNNARLLATSGGREQELAKGEGPWALFRMMARGLPEGRGGTIRVTFNGAAPVTLELTGPGAGPVVQRGGLAGQACVAQVTQ